MDNLPKGQAQERDGEGRSSNKPGTYFHEKAGKWVEASNTPQADAVVRQGYVLATSEHKKFIASERQKINKAKE